jgi:hypothetical protein
VAKPDPDVESAMDSICALGCEIVDAYISALTRGEARPEYRALDRAQRASLLAELQSVMAVYRCGDSDAPQAARSGQRR